MKIVAVCLVLAAFIGGGCAARVEAPGLATVEPPPPVAVEPPPPVVVGTPPRTRVRAVEPSRRSVARVGACPCGTALVCTGPRGGRYCITSSGNKRYLRRR